MAFPVGGPYRDQRSMTKHFRSRCLLLSGGRRSFHRHATRRHRGLHFRVVWHPKEEPGTRGHHDCTIEVRLLEDSRSTLVSLRMQCAAMWATTRRMKLLQPKKYGADLLHLIPSSRFL